MDIPYSLENARVGYAYVPYQQFKDLYDAQNALMRGTVFKELDIPFEAYASNPIMNPFK